MRILTVKNDVVTYDEKKKVPMLVVDEGAFSDAINAVVVVRYYDEYLIKRHNSQIRKDNAEKIKAEKAHATDSVEYMKACIDSESAEEEIKTYNNTLKALNVEKNKLKDVVCPDDLKEIVTFYALILSRVTGIDTDDNKPMIGHIDGTKELYKRCYDFARATINRDCDWTESDKQEFKGIKNDILKIGSRLNGKASTFRKGFTYKVSSKTVNSLIASVTPKNKFKDNWDIKKTYDNFSAFHKIFIASVLDIGTESVKKSNSVAL